MQLLFVLFWYLNFSINLSSFPPWGTAHNGARDLLISDKLRGGHRLGSYDDKFAHTLNESMNLYAVFYFNKWKSNMSEVFIAFQNGNWYVIHETLCSE